MFKKINNLLIIFLEEPEKEVSVREYARICKLAPATASKYLKEFAKEGILKERKERNSNLYKANQESEVYKDIKKSENIKNIKSSDLITYLIEELNHPLAIFLFGSYAKGENRKGSDIDLFILTREKKEIKTASYEKILKAPIQLFIFTEDELKRVKKKNPELLNNIINGTKVYGFWEAF